MDFSEAELLEMITKPLNPEEMAAYEEVMESDAFAQMLIQYHFSAMLEAHRSVVLGMFEQAEPSLEDMLLGLCFFWLDMIESAVPDIDRDLVEFWRQYPNLLCQILVNFSSSILGQFRDQLNLEIPEEFNDMHRAWSLVLPVPQKKYEIDDASIAQANQINYVLGTYQKTIEEEDLKLDTGDYFDIWSHVLLQTYLFGFSDNHELYFLMAVNWNILGPQLRLFVDMLYLLKGSEHLLLEGNEEKLRTVMSDERVAQMIQQRWGSLPGFQALENLFSVQDALLDE